MKVEVEHVHHQPEEAPRVDFVPGVSVPKALFFLAAGLSCAMSIYLFFAGDREQGIFVGLWVPSILSAGNLLIERDHHE
jgi:hypothetical protein